MYGRRQASFVEIISTSSEISTFQFGYTLDQSATERKLREYSIVLYHFLDNVGLTARSWKLSGSSHLSQPFQWILFGAVAGHWRRTTDAVRLYE